MIIDKKKDNLKNEVLELHSIFQQSKIVAEIDPSDKNKKSLEKNHKVFFNKLEEYNTYNNKLMKSANVDLMFEHFFDFDKTMQEIGKRSTANNVLIYQIKENKKRRFN